MVVAPKPVQDKLQPVFALVIGAVAAFFVGSGLKLESITWAQQWTGRTAPGFGKGEERLEFQAYPVRHRNAAFLEGPLRAILGGLPNIRIITDSQNNQILVSAPPEFLPVVGELITRLDQPAEINPRERLQLRTFRCTPDNVGVVVEEIRRQFSGDTSLRVAGDPGTGQVFIVGPGTLLRQLEELLTSWGLSPDAGVPTRGVDGAVQGGPTTPLGPPFPRPWTAGGVPPLSPLPATSRSPEVGTEPTSAIPSLEPAPEAPVSIVVPRSRPDYRVGLGAQPEELESLFVETTHVPLQRIREELSLVLGARLEPAPSSETTQAEFRFVEPRGRWVDIGFDSHHSGVWIYGPRTLARQMASLVRALDRPDSGETVVRVLPMGRVNPEKLKEAVEAFRTGRTKPPSQGGTNPLRDDKSGSAGTSSGRAPFGLVEQVAPLFGASGKATPRFQEAATKRETQGFYPADNQVQLASYQQQLPPGGPASPEAFPAEAPRAAEQAPLIPALRGDVEVESLPDLDVLILRGRQRDVEELSRIIAELERLSALAEPQIEVYPLRHVNCLSLARLIQQVQTELVGRRQGRVTMTPLVKPNALLLIGWGEAMEVIKVLISKLDQPVSPHTELRIFPLKRANATIARTTIASAFIARGGLSPDVQVIADVATNALIVRASPSDMREVELLIRQLEGESQAVLQTRLFRLRFTLASDVASTLQTAISGAVGGLQRKSAVLELVGIDREKQEIVRSGLLTDVQIVPNIQTNTLVVTAPAESMDLIAALIAELDTPTAVAQIKVFRVVNADATALANLLRTLFPPQPIGTQLAGAEGETTLIPLRFSVDVRTNSIIATGSRGDLAIVEALLLRLDEEEVRQRISTVYRLKNAPAADVARSINDFLRTERQLQLAAPGVLSPFLQIESEVVVVPEPVSNSLIISATPRFFSDIMELVERLDEVPPQVIIQALIVEVELSRVDEFGAEFGLQDSVLFDRSVVATTLSPGFNFNNQPLGNAGSARSLATSEKIGTQGLTHFSLGRINTELGYGGLVFSASSENLSILLRALQDRRQLRVLSRPQIMTLDNQPAFIQVGKRVPRIIGTRFYAGTQFNAVELEPVGLILSVTPRISPDGTVVMQVDAEKSELGPESEGIPVSISGGEVIRSPSVNVTTAQTTVSASDGETIVIGGLITKYNTAGSRRIPYLADIPLVGRLFRTDSARERRSELLIILTPRVVRNPEDAERIKQEETARIHFVLSDVLSIHGPIGLPAEEGLAGHLTEVPVIFPTLFPRCLPGRGAACHEKLTVRPAPAQQGALPQPTVIPHPQGNVPPAHLHPGDYLQGHQGAP